jgi:hypothetical protein
MLPPHGDTYESANIFPPVRALPADEEINPAPVDFAIVAMLCPEEWADGVRRSFFVVSDEPLEAGSEDVVAVAGYPGECDLCLLSRGMRHHQISEHQ